MKHPAALIATETKYISISLIRKNMNSTIPPLFFHWFMKRLRKTIINAKHKSIAKASTIIYPRISRVNMAKKDMVRWRYSWRDAN